MLKNRSPNLINFHNIQRINNDLIQGINHIIINEWAAQVFKKNDY
jgi:hypothetical protein